MANLDSPEEFPRVPEEAPGGHPLREFFRKATARAFASFRALHDPGVESHICEEILGDFVHIDRIYRIRDREGRRLRDLSAMALEQHRSKSSGIERDLEVHQHVGDYALFMAGLFPEFLEKRGHRADQPLLAYVGSVLVTMKQPVDYYIVEGRSAYSHVAHLYRPLDSSRSGVFDRLSNRFEDYLELMRRIRDHLRDAPALESGEIIT